MITRTKYNTDTPLVLMRGDNAEDHVLVALEPGQEVATSKKYVEQLAKATARSRLDELKIKPTEAELKVLEEAEPVKELAK